MDTQTLSKFTVVELKKKLREEKLPVSGRKSVLIQRLADYYQTRENSENVVTCNAVPKVKKPKTPKKIQPIREYNIAPMHEPLEQSATSFVLPPLQPLGITTDESPLNFIHPVVGTKETAKTLDTLYMKGYISSGEYEQRLKRLKDSDNFYASSLCVSLQNLSLQEENQKNTTTINAMDRKKWSLAIKEERNEDLADLCTKLTSALQSINVNNLNLAEQEQLERICGMLQKLRFQHMKYLSMTQIYSKITYLLSNIHDELFLLPLLQTISSLGNISLDIRKTLLSNNIERLLQIAEEQIQKKYTMDVTIQICKALRSIVRSNNISILSMDQKTRLVSFLMTLCRNIHSHVEVLEHALTCLSIPCYGDLDIVLKESYFLETVSTHLSNYNLLVVTGAVTVFVNVTAGSDEITDRVIQMGVLDKIIAILRHYFLEESEVARKLVKECYFCLSNFGGGTKQQAETCMDRGLMSLLVSQYEGATKETKREMLWCISNFLLSKSEVRYFDNEKIFLVALDMLQDPDVSDADGEQLRKGLHFAKTAILPSLAFDHPGIDTLFELLQ